MWSTRTHQLRRGSVVSIELAQRPVSFSDALHLWQTDGAFRVFFTRLLAACPFSAFRWETPPITAMSAGRPFEFALLDSPELETEPDPAAFADHFKSAACDDIVWFPNLGHDAILVVPRPLGDSSAYGHLAAFVRKGPDEQRHALWQLVGKLMESRLGATPVWLSTAGAGVPWLHVRLDKRPKYYSHAQYRENPLGQ